MISVILFHCFRTKEAAEETSQELTTTSGTIIDKSHENDPPELNIVREEVRRLVPLPSSRRMVDLASFVEQIREVERHSVECKFGGHFIHAGTNHFGLVSELKYVCKQEICPATKNVFTAVPQELNMDAVWGSLSVGMGFSQSEEYFAIMQSPFMSNPIYQKYEKRLGDFMSELKVETITNNINEEKRAAAIEGNVTETGLSRVTIVVDGVWCKRTYGHGFDARSGAAVIIGEKSKKVLFANVRNKYCVICQSANRKNEKPKEHICNANWKSSSTSMEADIILEGIKWLYEEHGVICDKIVGDGDSSVITKVRQAMRSYKLENIEKIECANHAIRNFRKKLHSVAENTKMFPGKEGLQARKILKSKIEVLTLEARKLIRDCGLKLTDKNSNEKETVETLKKSIRNLPFHVFGDHTRCSDSCQGLSTEENTIPVLQKSGMFLAIEEALMRVVALSDSLVFNKTNNAAENFMSTITKFTGGKRVDYSRGGSFGRRVCAAVLSQSEPCNEWQRKQYKAIYKRNPLSPMTRLIVKRSKKLLLKKKYKSRKALFLENNCNSPQKNKDQNSSKNKQQKDLDYGASDIPEDQLTALCKEFYDNRVCVAKEVITEIEELTREQANSQKWKKERRIRITASNVKKIACRRTSTSTAPLVKNMLYPPDLRTDAVLWGKSNEDVARKLYEERYKVSVSKCGLYIDEEYPFLAASPDGIVHSQDGSYLIEIKCPYNARYCATIREACARIKTFPLSVRENGELFLPRKSEYFYQIQTQLQCCNLDRCDLVVYIPNDMEVITIRRENEFTSNIIGSLFNFYFECLLPEIVDSRVERSLPIREVKKVFKENRGKQKTTDPRNNSY